MQRRITGERTAALEGTGEMKREAPERGADAARNVDRRTGQGAAKDRGTETGPSKSPAKEPEAPARDRGRGGLDLGL